MKSHVHNSKLLTLTLQVTTVTGVTVTDLAAAVRLNQLAKFWTYKELIGKFDGVFQVVLRVQFISADGLARLKDTVRHFFVIHIFSPNQSII